MKDENFIPLPQLCNQYKIEMSFFSDLDEFGLIELQTIEETYYIHKDRIVDIEKIIRLQRELNLNLEGIDTVFNLLSRIEELTMEVNNLRNRLQRFEAED
jgi:hypothetical protein